ncbi:hypothetical protein DMENIID0001_140900 [Sergentomyia squamirostris]
MANSLKSLWFFIFCAITSIQWREIPHIVDARRAHLIDDDGPRRTHRPAVLTLERLCFVLKYKAVKKAIKAVKA